MNRAFTIQEKKPGRLSPSFRPRACMHLFASSYFPMRLWFVPLSERRKIFRLRVSQVFPLLSFLLSSFSSFRELLFLPSVFPFPKKRMSDHFLSGLKKKKEERGKAPMKRKKRRKPGAAANEGKKAITACKPRPEDNDISRWSGKLQREKRKKIPIGMCPCVLFNEKG